MSDLKRHDRSSYMSGYRQALADVQAGRSRAGKALGKTALVERDERARTLAALRELRAIIGEGDFGGQEDLDSIVMRIFVGPARVMLARMESGRTVVIDT